MDRIVEGRVVLLVGSEEEEHVVPRDQLPDGVTEGTWVRVRFEGGSLVEAELDLDATAQIKTRITETMARLRRRGRKLGEPR